VPSCRMHAATAAAACIHACTWRQEHCCCGDQFALIEKWVKELTACALETTARVKAGWTTRRTTYLYWRKRIVTEHVPLGSTGKIATNGNEEAPMNTASHVPKKTVAVHHAGGRNCAQVKLGLGISFWGNEATQLVLANLRFAQNPQ